MSAQPYELRLGRWQEVLQDVDEVDCLCTDPPYGERTHAGQRAARRRDPKRDPVKRRLNDRGLSYACWTPADVEAFVKAWVPRVRGWFVAFTSHDLVAAYEAALERANRYVFAPLAVTMPGLNVRLGGDGPSNWTVWLVVARPKRAPWSKWGTLRGAYYGPCHDHGQNALDRSQHATKGTKPLWLMRQVICDYSRPGDLVCDPCAGGATTLLAAALEGRRSVGAECDPETYAKAAARLEAGYTLPLPGLVDVEAAEQTSLFGGES